MLQSLAIDTERRPGDRLQPSRTDLFAAPGARAKRPGLEAGQRGLDLAEMLHIAIPKREVSLLLKHLAGRRRLGPIGHLARRLDSLGELGPQAVAFGEEREPWIGLIVRHPRIVLGPRSRLGGEVRYTPREYWRKPMAIAIDPVCGMHVDTETSDLKLEHEGKTYWFCGKGCLLDFKDDPEKYLDPDYQPSM